MAKADLPGARASNPVVRRAETRIAGLRLLAVLALLAGCRARESAARVVVPVEPTVIGGTDAGLAPGPHLSVGSDAGDAPGRPIAQADASPVVVTVSVISLAGRMRRWEVFASGRVVYRDSSPLSGGDVEVSLTPDAVWGLAAGLRACDVCTMSKRPYVPTSGTLERRGIDLADGGESCTLSLPTDTWKKDAKRCEAAIRRALAPLEKTDCDCRYPPSSSR